MLFTNAASIYYFVVCHCANLQIWWQVVGTKPILYRVAIMWTTEVLEEAWLSRSSYTDGEKHLWPAIHDWYVRLHSADLRPPMICAVIVWR